ncbi:MAG: hypothetical protein K1X72_09840 [Pyrinomonadaceae bacterium]|nr:hypothetical protein [Pyrinomonadaceae bacterium]
MSSSFWKKISLFFILLIVFSKTTIAQDIWTEIATKNFNIVGNTNSKDLTSFAEKLENFQDFFQQNFPKTKIQTPFSTNLIVFKDDVSLNPFRLKQKYSNQCFLPANDANYGIISLENNESFEQILEGYAKFLLENNIGRNKLPTWMFEGLGEVFKNTKFSGETVFEFGVSQKNITILQQNKLIPLNALLETDNFTFQSQGEERKALFRAESWALLQYLLRDADGLSKIEEFIDLRKNEFDANKILIDVFRTGNVQLNEDFPKFVQKGSYKNWKINLTQKVNSFHYKISKVTESKWFAVLADYLFYSDRLKESEALVEKSLNLEPNQTLALTTLSLIKTRQFYYEEAQGLAEKAVEIEPENYLNYYRFALCLSKQGMTEFGFVSGYSFGIANLIRENLKKSISLNPEFTAPYSLFAFVNFVRNEQLDDSIKSITQILQIAPGNQQFQLRLAELNLRKENFFDARKIAYQVLQNTPFEGVKLYAQNTIQRIDATEYQLNLIRNEKKKNVNEDIVSEKPLNEEEIIKLREKAINDQIKVTLRRPKTDELRIFGNLKRIECAKNQVDFVVLTQTGLIKLQANSLDGISLLSLVPEMSDYRLGCGTLVKENFASIIYKKNPTKTDEIVSIEFVPKSFKL